MFDRNGSSQLLVLLRRLALLALLAAPVVASAQGAYNFGSVAVGQSSAAATVTYTFTAAASLSTPVAVVTQGGAVGDYTNPGSGSCDTNPAASYKAGDSCTVGVVFTPSAPGARLGAVLLQSSTGALVGTVPLVGVGTAPLIGLSSGGRIVLAGTGTAGYSGDGAQATSAQLNSPSGLALDSAWNLYVADSAAHVVRKISIGGGGKISTYAGTGTQGYSGDGGQATSAELDSPTGLAVDGAGNLYIGSAAGTGGNNVIRMVTPAGVISTVAGKTPGYDFGAGNVPATSVLLYDPAWVAVDGLGSFYFSAAPEQRVERVDSSGMLRNYAGDGQAGDAGDGGPAVQAQLEQPAGIAIASDGSLYIAEGSGEVRKVTVAGTISELALLPGANPAGIAVDAASSVYVADGASGQLWVINASGSASVVAGPIALKGSNTGGATTSLGGVAVDGLGNVYLADAGNHQVLILDRQEPSVTFPQTTPGQSSAAQNVTVWNLGNQPLTISSITTAANFSLGGPDTTCTEVTQQIQPGANCVLGLEFIPSEGGSLGSSVLLTDDSLNASAATQQVVLVGSATPAPVTIMAESPNSYFGSTTPVNVTVTCGTGATVTGTVNFSAAGVSLGSASLQNGTAFISVSVTAANGFVAGQNSITVSFTGSAAFASATGAATLFVGTPSYTLFATPSVTLSAGQAADVILSLKSSYYNGTVSFKTQVSGGSGLTASAPSVTLAASTTSNVTTVLTLTTSNAARSRAPALPWQSGGALLCAVLMAAPLARRNRRALAILLTAAALMLVGCLASCSSGGGSASKGVYTVTVTPTGTGTVTDAAPVSITVTVN